MEEINYDGLLNHKVIKKTFSNTSAFMLFCTCYFLYSLASDGGYATMVAILIVCILVIGALSRYSEKSKLQELVTFYNDSIENNNFLEVDDTLKNKLITISEYTISAKLEVVCESEFVYDDETRIYKAENTNIVIINGYFEDVSLSKDNAFIKGVRRKYIMVFVDFNYYMCCIDNLMCYEKGTRWAKGYTKIALESNKIDYTKW